MNASAGRVVSIDEAAHLPDSEVGSKALLLAQLRSGEFDVPDGFVVLATAFDRLAKDALVVDRLDRLWSAASDGGTADIARIAREARRIIHGIRPDSALERDILTRYHGLADDSDAPAVAVRTSAALSSGDEPALASVFSRHLNVSGDDMVLGQIRSCWASAFSERALALYAQRLGRPRPRLAVLVQPMVPADRSGILVPLDGGDELLIEATFGLGEPIATGVVEPDRYVCDRATAELRESKIGDKTVEMAGGADSPGHVFVPPDRRCIAVLDQDQLQPLCRLSEAVDHHAGSPQEVEWSSVGDTYFVTQVRPITAGPGDRSAMQFGVPHVLSGIGVGAGVVTGRARVIRDVDDPNEALSVGAGDIIVAPATTPMWSSIIGRADAVVTDRGDAHCQTSLMCHALGLPAVLGTKTATTDLIDGSTITVDADRGWVLVNR